MQDILETIFCGRLQPFSDDARLTGIFKKPVSQKVFVSLLGLDCDSQADLKNHGGPEKAVHQFSRKNYSVLAGLFPEISAPFSTGSLGENLSSENFHESTICIGDVVRVGGCTLQVSQPRTLCWKVDKKFSSDGLAQSMQTRGLTGWYYRVLQEGHIKPGDTMSILDRPNDFLPLSVFLQTWQAHRPDPDQLWKIAQAPGLSQAWQQRLHKRIDWLKNQQA
ncbi:MAG: MOSC domain-containing protein [Gammaproteobacteria bacterium]|nr:MOSC domain-containing protein [Gammaproteobacteria bacterium]